MPLARRLPLRSVQPAAGSVSVNVAPRVSLFEASIVPPCAVAIERAIDSPMPRPWALVV